MKPSFLVFTDLSPRSRRAAWYAALLAQAAGGQVVLVHMEAIPPAEPEVGLFTLSAEYYQQEQDAQAALHALAGQLPAPAVVEPAVSSVTQVLTDFVDRWQPVVLVLGTVPEQDMLDAIWYNQMLPALRDAGLPVLLVPDEAALDPVLPRLVAVAADGREFRLAASAAVGPAVLSSWPAAFSVVHVAPPGGTGINRAVAAVHHSGLLPPAAACLPYEARQQPCSAGIVQAVLDVQADLLVLLTRPRSLVSSMFGGGVAAHVVRNCPVPTLLLPTAEVPQPEPEPKTIDGMSYSYPATLGAALTSLLARPARA
ncbi:universal stress protein [Hymenobacter aquaticus]|uniref:Universal stress protein n=1 Tax=Hymenobacter aquaticus TaxID=1867101 RepID=A0A4Z0Q5B5_9BACT|nr:universal stress protein [Hymenobacter aquaticus]TGE23872.1 universal stress protein [Hymenobacter aquaticus]